MGVGSLGAVSLKPMAQRQPCAAACASQSGVPMGDPGISCPANGGRWAKDADVRSHSGLAACVLASAAPLQAWCGLTSSTAFQHAHPGHTPRCDRAL